MKIFRYQRLTLLMYITYGLLFLVNCNQLSKGQQRKKFEYLYKMNNYTSLFREYTNELTYFNDIDFYEGRMKKLYEDVNKMEPVDGWGASKVLQENFLKTIDDNIGTLNSLKKKKLRSDENIRMEYEVIIMNERVNEFLKSLDDEIAKVGKE